MSLTARWPERWSEDEKIFNFLCVRWTFNIHHCMSRTLALSIENRTVSVTSLVCQGEWRYRQGGHPWQLGKLVHYSVVNLITTGFYYRGFSCAISFNPGWWPWYESSIWVNRECRWFSIHVVHFPSTLVEINWSALK